MEIKRDPNILTIQSINHGQCYLSPEIYEITSNDHPSRGYKKGGKVRLISPGRENREPGHHFNKEYKTVCRLDAQMAEFCGIEIKHLKLIE